MTQYHMFFWTRVAAGLPIRDISTLEINPQWGQKTQLI